MFREVRRKDRLADQAEGTALLTSGEYGILSVLGDDEYPYGVPINYVYVSDCIYLHGFLGGHKIDAIQNHPKVCFTVVGDTQVRPDHISTNYTSVIVFGKAEILPPSDDAERKKAFDAIIEKFVPGDPERTNNYIASAEKNTNIIKINIEHMSCKKRDVK